MKERLTRELKWKDFDVMGRGGHSLQQSVPEPAEVVKFLCVQNEGGGRTV